MDGQTRQVWTTATTVQEALDQIGYRQANLWTSSDRSTRLPLDGYQLTLRTPKSVTIVADGAKRTITTTAATVGEALDQAGIDIDADDKVSPLATSPVRTGMTITLTRLTTKTTTTEAVRRVQDHREDRRGRRPGLAHRADQGRDRAAAGHHRDDVRQRQADQLEGHQAGRDEEAGGRGRRGRPGAGVVPPPVAQPAGCADFPTTGGLNWCGLAQCESGLNPNAYNPAGPYYGLYQFD